MVSAGGGGAALQASVASSTILRTSASMPAMIFSPTPNCSSRSLYILIGSRSFQRSSSPSGRYLAGSAREWPLQR
jgi:hypothetical protein